MTGYASREVLGKSRLKNVLIDQEGSGILSCAKQCPVAGVLKEGKDRVSFYSSEYDTLR